MTTGTVSAEGADLVYDVEGAGPLLLLIPGRGGTALRFAEVAAILQDEYRVVRYDRRCCGRSSGDRSRPMDVTQQARDAIAVINDCGADSAYIAGHSAGGAIAVRMAEYYPETVLGMVAHEPMIVSVLPDREDWIAFSREVDRRYRAEGIGAAAKLLAGSMVGMAPPGGAQGGPPPGGAGDDAFFFDGEVMPLSYYWPDLDRLARTAPNLILSKGRSSADAYYARAADVIGEQVGCPVRTLSGNHIAHIIDPTTFAAELRAVLAELRAAPAA